MKGIAHFASGLAVATFFPEIVYGASQNLSLAPLLGGAAGLLPDTLDFKVVRYFSRLDEEIDPAIITDGAGCPDPRGIAERIAGAMNRAFDSGEQVNVHLHTLKLAVDLWQQYSVAFDLVKSQVVVRIGPAVTTGGIPVARDIPSSEARGPVEGRAHVRAPILHTYDGEITIDIFSGPSLTFERAGGEVQVTFLRWHRAWSHSLFMALVVGAAGLLIAPVVGLVMALATLTHAAQDQMGYMGCNWLFPFTRERTMGLKLMRSGDAIPNFLTVWVSLAIILLNLDRFSTAPSIPVVPYLLGVVVVPCLFLLGLGAWALLRVPRAPRAAREPAVVLAAVEALDETDEVDI
jgi:membrane-bound metal-dependent hydrolase YbcI (DUF457 family)